MSLDLLNKFTQSPKSPLLCLEINPPRGTDLDHIFSRLDGKLDGIDFLNVTDSALARMKLSPLPFASLLKQRYGIDPLVNISCRDRNLIALQADLLAGWVTGIRSIVALTGDAVSVGDSPDRKGVFEVNSIGLLAAIQTLNSGKDLAGNELRGSPAYVPGVVVNPNAKNIGAEIRRLKKKKDAGAVYALSQPVFEEESSLQFFKEAQAVEIPIMMGLLPLKSVKSAASISKIPGIKFPEKIMAMIEGTPDKDLSDFFLEHSLKLAELNREYVAGFHVVSGTTPLLALELSKQLSHYISGLPKVGATC